MRLGLPGAGPRSEGASELLLHHRGIGLSVGRWPQPRDLPTAPRIHTTAGPTFRSRWLGAEQLGWGGGRLPGRRGSGVLVPQLGTGLRLEFPFHRE